MTIHETYMRRCIELAQLGASSVAPNPMVGAILVHDSKIIGEGIHEVYGGPHAEVNCIASVNETKKHLVSDSTMYVSLEPCAHFGKTPPCADLLIKHKIPEVVIGCRDPFVAVNGKGIEKLLAAGVKVVTGVLEEDCKNLNKRFFIFNTQHRPYIILKWAQTADGKIGNYGNNRLRITNEITNRLVHKWRSEESAIMVGTNTALMDDPMLTNRLWMGNDPVRVVLDMELKLPASSHLLDKSVRTIVFNLLKHEDGDQVSYYQITHDVSIIHQVLNGLYQMKMMSVMVEGGARLLQSFIDEGLWDEARVITNNSLLAPDGVPSPVLGDYRLQCEEQSGNDMIKYYLH